MSDPRFGPPRWPPPRPRLAKTPDPIPPDAGAHLAYDFPRRGDGVAAPAWVDQWLAEVWAGAGAGCGVAKDVPG